MSDLAGLGKFNFSEKIKLVEDKIKEFKASVSEENNTLLAGAESDISFEGIDEFLTPENKARLLALKSGDADIKESVSELELKTSFKHKQEFLDFFGLDPNSADFDTKLRIAQQYMKDNGITTITIDGDAYNVITGPESYQNVILGTTGNDLILATDVSRVHAEDGNDFILASKVEQITGDKGDDAIIVQTNLGSNTATAYSGSEGDDFLWINNTSNISAGVFGNDGDDIIYTKNCEQVSGSQGGDKVYVDGGLEIISTPEHQGDEVYSVNNEGNVLWSKQDGNHKPGDIEDANSYSELDADHNGTVSDGEYYDVANDYLTRVKPPVDPEDPDDPDDPVDPPVAPKIEFANKKEFLEYFGLDPNNDNFEAKLKEAQDYMKKYSLTSVKIAGEDYNVITGPNKGKELNGTNGRDLILATSEVSRVDAKGGEDFVIAKGPDVHGGDGNDALVVQYDKNGVSNLVGGDAGNDFVWVVDKKNSYLTSVSGGEGDDLIYTKGVMSIHGEDNDDEAGGTNMIYSDDKGTYTDISSFSANGEQDIYYMPETNSFNNQSNILINHQYTKKSDLAALNSYSTLDANSDGNVSQEEWFKQGDDYLVNNTFTLPDPNLKRKNEINAEIDKINKQIEDLTQLIKNLPKNIFNLAKRLQYNRELVQLKMQLLKLQAELKKLENPEPTGK